MAVRVSYPFMLIITAPERGGTFEAYAAASTWIYAEWVMPGM